MALIPLGKLSSAAAVAAGDGSASHSKLAAEAELCGHSQQRHSPCGRETIQIKYEHA